MKFLRELSVRLGRDLNGAPVVIDVAGFSHMLICGETRSGKSALTYLLLGELAAHFETVRIVGIDPTSVLLGPLYDRFPDPWMVLGTTDHQRMLDTLEGGLVGEMDRRLLLLRQSGLDKFEVFSRDLPLVVIVLEELPAIVRSLESFDKVSGAKPAEKLAGRARLAIERLLSESAKVGFRIVALAQRPDADVIGGYSRAQMPTRIALRMGAAEDFRMALSDVTPELVQLGMNSPAGVGLIRTPGTDPLRRFRVDHVPDYQSFVQRIEATTPGWLTKSAGIKSFGRPSLDLLARSTGGDS